MPFDITHLHDVISQIYGEKPHPDVPSIKVKDYAAYAGVAAKMFYNSTPEPKQVETAYHSLRNSEIAPAEFDRLWDVAKPLANRLLDRDPTIHDLMMLVGQHPHQVQSYYADHPHPQYPEASAGDISRYAAVSLYPARKLSGREPNLVELHKFVVGGYTMDDIVAHYSEGKTSSQDSPSGGGQMPGQMPGGGQQ